MGYCPTVSMTSLKENNLKPVNRTLFTEFTADASSLAPERMENQPWWLGKNAAQKKNINST